VERADGVIELQPVLPVSADQRWFWTDRWQAMEREADADIGAGRIRTLDGVDGLTRHLERVSGLPADAAGDRGTRSPHRSRRTGSASLRWSRASSSRSCESSSILPVSATARILRPAGLAVCG
jgi:hypothetical protein